MGVHHLEGHLLSPFLSADPPEFPFVALLVSGGHTQLMRVDGVGAYTLLGETIDDAAGEAFDKTAKMLDLGYPGGPALSKLAERGDPTAFKLPRPLLRGDNVDFSFAGLKTAVWIQQQRLVAAGALTEQARADLAASTQAAIVDVLVAKARLALQATGLRRLVVAGGVGANRELRSRLDALAVAGADERGIQRGAQRGSPRDLQGLRVHYPELHLCTDNGAMIALAAAMRLRAGRAEPTRAYHFDVKPRWDLTSH